MGIFSKPKSDPPDFNNITPLGVHPTQKSESTTPKPQDPPDLTIPVIVGTIVGSELLQDN